MMKSKASAKYVRVPPRKARLIADMVRGKGTNEATAILRFTPNRSAKILEKLLKSAIANATSDGKVDVDLLFIQELMVNEGPVLKRFTPRAHGRATRINKRTSHIHMVLAER